MIAGVLRKARRFAEDPVLRRWAIGAALGRHRRPARGAPHCPPYLRALPLPGDDDAPTGGPGMAPAAAAPAGSLTLDLPGDTAIVDAASPGALFDRTFADIETLLAVHRFAWLPLQGRAADPAWVDILWRAWSARFATPDDSWAWHPYTAAERAINILDFGDRVGLPGERSATLSLLARHAGAIARRLEYFGDHDTGNHLSNNGHGLYRIGLALGLARAVELGQRILVAEAGRIFRPSGVLREGSTHYHLLLTRNYVDAWLAARRHARPEAETLGDIVRRALAALPWLVLPGGLPLIGDISPDCPPGFLAGLLPDGDPEDGWTGLLDTDARAALATMKAGVRPISPDRLAADGWIRFSDGPWSLLAHVPPDGWPPMPGHAHQDMGSFELHHGRTALVVDPGRGAYGETDEAAHYASAAAHNGLVVDGEAPFPPNKPYYDESFRRRICGAPPRVVRRRDGVTIAHNGFGRMSGLGEAERRVSFGPAGLTIADRVAGSGSHTVTRRLHTPLVVADGGDGSTTVTLTGDNVRYRVVADGPIVVRPVRRWTAYGRPERAHVLEVTTRMTLPATLRMTVEIA